MQSNFDGKALFITYYIMKLTKENLIRIDLKWFTWKLGMQRVKVWKDKGSKGLGESIPLSHEVQSKPPCFLNSWWRLGAAEHKLYLRLGQWFIAKGFVSTSSLTNLTFTKWSSRISSKHSSNLTVDLGYYCSFYTCCRVFKPIHIVTQIVMNKFAQRCLLKISLKFSAILKSDASASLNRWDLSLAE